MTFLKKEGKNKTTKTTFFMIEEKGDNNNKQLWVCLF